MILWAWPLAKEFSHQLIVWNVGQGQWVTLVDNRGCWHFDTGGERPPWKEVMRLCRARRNFLTYSHWDWDHISFTGGLKNFLPQVCVLHPPVGRASPRKMRLLRGLRACAEREVFTSWSDPHGRNANGLSRVVWWRGVLIPGDSTRVEEKFWVHAFKQLRETRILILGHHGSQTSTSNALLDRIPYTLAAVASARFRRYRHPHKRVERDLQLREIPLLRTEEWGHLIFDL
ncbi:MAG: hydrolase [Bdellovibrionales bacterium]|nr:hydrolase [Bdellovibrionales bacterium]